VLIAVFVPDGPGRKPSQKINLSASFKVFKNPDFRGAAFGYYGHMWELYAFWAFVPVILQTYISLHEGMQINVSVWSFIIIGIGGISCVIGGYLSESMGAISVFVGREKFVFSLPYFLGNGGDCRLTFVFDFSGSKCTRLLNYLSGMWQPIYLYLALVAGPIFGLVMLRTQGKTIL